MEEVKDNQEKKDQKKTKNSEINKLKAKIEKLELKITNLYRYVQIVSLIFLNRKGKYGRICKSNKTSF